MKTRRPRKRQYAYGVRVPAALYEAVEAERDHLLKAESLLGCLSASMQQESLGAQSPNYSDVADLARDLIKQSVGNLDSLNLQKLLTRDKIKDSFLVPDYVGFSRPDLLTPQQEYPISIERLDPVFYPCEAGVL